MILAKSAAGIVMITTSCRRACSIRCSTHSWPGARQQGKPNLPRIAKDACKILKALARRALWRRHSRTFARAHSEISPKLSHDFTRFPRRIYRRSTRPSVKRSGTNNREEWGLPPGRRHWAHSLSLGMRLSRATNDACSHNDVNPANLLWDGSQVWMVDWESAALSTSHA